MSAVTDTIRNGVDTEQMFATLDLIKAQPEAAKAFVNEAAARVVDRALALSGGAGYVKEAPSRAPTATSRPAPSCTRSAPTAPTTTSATSPSAKRHRCTEVAHRGSS